MKRFAAELQLRITAIDWCRVESELDQFGAAIMGPLLTTEECTALAALYPRPGVFRSRVVMARHGFGRGEYQYFANPLPEPIQALRQDLYPRLVPVANRWQELLGRPTRYPDGLAAFLERCHAAGQRLPTPLLLRYVQGDFNCLHQDLYGAEVFPLQVAVLLSEPGRDFTGGEFILTEQRPRQQSRAMVVPLGQGDGVVFAVNSRPVRGSRGDYQVKMRHGVSRLLTGRRHVLGLIFHDAA